MSRACLVPGHVASALRAGFVLLLLLLGLGACTDAIPEFDLVGARRATLTVIVSESVSFRGLRPRKEVRVGLRGAPVASASGVALETEILWAELSYRDNEGDIVSVATDGTRDDPTFDQLDLARRAVLEALVTLPVRVGLTRAAGITSFDGLESALAAAGERAIAEGGDAALIQKAVAGLAQLLDDGRILRGLAAAGIGAAPPALSDRGGAAHRDVEVYVAGRGVTRVRVEGNAGRAPGGEASATFEGRVADDALFVGDPGPEPPAQIGPVVLDEMSVTVSTQYTGPDLQPLRGHFAVESPHAEGPLVTRSVDFILVVDR